MKLFFAWRAKVRAPKWIFGGFDIKEFKGRERFDDDIRAAVKSGVERALAELPKPTDPATLLIVKSVGVAVTSRAGDYTVEQLGARMTGQASGVRVFVDSNGLYAGIEAE